MQSHTYELKEIALPAKFMLSQSNGNLLASLPVTGNFSKFILDHAEINNRSGNAAISGIAGVLPISVWGAGKWDDSEYAAGTVFVDDTAHAQDETANNFELDTVGVNNDGIALYSSVPFSVASIVVGTASANSTAWAMYYSKSSSGTGFSSNYTQITNPLVAPSFGSTGEKLVLFNKPHDWVKTTSATAIVNRHGLGIPADKYVIVIKATTAPDTTQGKADIAVLGDAYYCKEGLADNGVHLIGGMHGEIILPSYFEGLSVIVSDVSALQSRATGNYRLG